MSIDNISENQFRFAASDDYQEQMTRELEEAPTYKVTLDSGAGEMLIRSVKTRFKGDGPVSTRTCVSAKSLQYKLSQSSNLPDDIPRERYERIDVLGEGGAGVVYEMTDHNTGRDVAVKVLKEGEAESDREIFINEGRLAAALEHPNIIPIYDIDIDERGQAYLTMKKVEGQNLKSYIDGELNLATDEILPIFIKVCDALEYAHNLDKTHQDVKPENMMIGDYGEVFLIDWGAASLSGEDMQLSPVYMSPQQAAGEPPSVTDDIYCLGASLFHVLTKRFPTNADTINELWKKKVDGIIDMPTHHERRTIPRPLLAIALKAMHKDPAKRYQTVEAFSDDLKAYLSGYATTAEDAGLMTHLELLIKRRFREATILLTSVIMVMLMSAVYVFHVSRTESALVEAELKAYKLAEERKEHWLPVLSQDFSQPGPIDPRLNITADQVKDGGVYIHYRSPIGRITVDHEISSEPKIELKFTCDNIPSLTVHFADENPTNSRSYFVQTRFNLFDYSKGFQHLFRSAKACRDVLKTDGGLNTLTCWRRNNTWYGTLNGEPYMEVYDPDLTPESSVKSLLIGRHIPLGNLKLVSLSVWNRRPADYVSILDRGRLLRQVGELKKAREFFLQQASYEENKALADEARYLAASIDAGQSIETQIKELSAIADDVTNPYRYKALHHKAIILSKTDDWKNTLAVLEQVSQEAPELNTYDQLWGSLRSHISSLPKAEKEAILKRISMLPLGIQGYHDMELDDLTFLARSTADSISLNDNPVRDLKPLKGTPIRALDISGTLVEDLSPLAGKDLKELRFSRIPTPDLTPLSGMNLDMLMAKNLEGLDLSPLKNVRVRRLIFENFPLENLEAIRDTGVVYLRLRKSNLQNLDFMNGMNPSTLFAGENMIQDISGLKGISFLTLDLTGNKIHDLSPLKASSVALNLQLRGNPVSDISPLKGMPLKSLDICETYVRDLSVIRTLKNLQTLKINGSGCPDARFSEIQSKQPDLSTLGSLMVKSMSVRGAKLQDIEPLSKCVITEFLDLSYNPISDISPLKNQPLKTLDLDETGVKDLSVLNSLKNLEELSLSTSTPMKSEGATLLDGLASLPLKQLNLAGQQVSDLTPLNQCRELHYLDLTGCPVRDLSPLAMLPIDTLKLQNTQVNELSAIKTLRKLDSLTAGSENPETPSDLRDLSPLAGLSLSNLSLTNSRITDISPLSYCTIRSGLNLSGNPISDLTPLRGQDFWLLDISHTNITDLSEIQSMKHLRVIHVTGLTLDDASKKLLTNLDLKVIDEEEQQ